LSGTIPSEVPSVIVAGDTVQWQKAFGDYPIADGWAYTYAFISLESSTAPRISGADITVTDDGTTATFTIPAASSAKMDAGTWRFQGYATKAGERHLVDEGRRRVEPNLAVASSGSQLLHAEKALAVIEAALEGRLTSDVAQYTIGSRAISKIPIQDLYRLRAHYRHEIASLRRGGKLQSYEVTFVPAV